jgi:hypothetical protein
MVAGEFHPAANLFHGVVNELNGALAMAAFVRFGGRELAARGLEVIERSLHVRLAAAGCASGEVSDDEEEDDQTREKNRSTIHSDSFSP